MDRQVGGGRTRSRSPQVKRDRDGASVDDEGYRHQGRPNRQRRPAASANTPGKADENVIRKVLEKCAAPLVGENDETLVIEKV